MANITIGNNGNEARAEIAEDEENGIEAQPAVPASPTLKITDSLGVERLLLPNTSLGLALGTYVIEVME